MLKGLLAAALAGEAHQVADRARRAAMLWTAAAIAIAAGAGFLIGCFYIWVARQFGSIEASFAFGVGFILIGLICLLINRIAASRAARKRKMERGPELRGLAVAAGLAALPTLLRSRVALPALALPAIGFIALRIAAENRHGRSDDKPEA